jgi:hypothetical protein
MHGFVMQKVSFGCRDLRIIGRPGRIGAFDRFLQHALSHKDIWTTSRQAIAQRFADLNPD